MALLRVLRASVIVIDARSSITSSSSGPRRGTIDGVRSIQCTCMERSSSVPRQQAHKWAVTGATIRCYSGLSIFDRPRPFAVGVPIYLLPEEG